MVAIIKKIKYIIHRNAYRKAWRNRNLHNDTIPFDDYPESLVVVGAYTYGCIHVDYYGMTDERLEIGSFCSIASGVVFITGGGHLMDRFTTFPLERKIQGIKEETSKGAIIIKDDVWIGRDAMILSGVTVGQGAVIGARSVVAKDVPAYAVVIGNPAKVIRYRFTDIQIQELLKLDLKKIADYNKSKLMELYNKKITDIDISNLINEQTNK